MKKITQDERTKALVQEKRQLSDKLAQIERSSEEKDKSLKRQKREQMSLKQRLESGIDKRLARESRARRLAVDLGGGATAQGVNELVNLGIRAMADWRELASKKTGDESWFASNVDLLQSLPGSLGMILYAVEMWTRPKYAKDKDQKDTGEPYVPTPTREFVSELTKTLGHLGFSNLVRSLRFRWAESIDETKIKDQREKQITGQIAERDTQLAEVRKQSKAAADENARLKKELSDLRTMLEAASKKPASSSGGPMSGGG